MQDKKENNGDRSIQKVLKRAKEKKVYLFFYIV